MKLYPLKFQPILKSIIWGGSEISKFKNLKTEETGIGESWEISAVENNVSVIENGEFAGKPLDILINEAKGELVGEKIYEKLMHKMIYPFRYIQMTSWPKKDITLLEKPRCGM